MSYPHRAAPRDLTPGSQQSHSFHLSIPPPPLPPRFPTPNIPPIPPPPVPPIFYPPQFSGHPPQSHQQTFQGGLYSAPMWSAPPPTSDIEIRNQLMQKEEPFVEEFLVDPDSQALVDNWLRGKQRSQTINSSSVTRDIKIYSVKEKFNTALSLIKELENGARTLSVMVKTVTPQEWNRKCQEIEIKKKALTDILKEVKLTKEEVNAIKEKCSKRLKKRARLRRQAERRKKQKEEDKVRCLNLNFQIDNWQREMQEGVERVQREKELQREADAVLWGVTQKKTEAKRQVALLSSLLELRHVRVQRLTAAGKPVSHSQIDTFNTVIERLRRMWTKHLEECLLEEQVLRGMVGEAEIKEDPVKTYKKLVLQEWQTALFGAVETIESNPRGNTLIDIRRAWDQFAVKGQTVLSSTISPGWVLPVPPSSDTTWRSLLKY